MTKKLKAKSYRLAMRKLWNKGCDVTCECDCHIDFSIDKREHGCYTCKKGKWKL